MKDYWFPWSPTKFRQDTMHLTDDQELIYRRLIDFYMETKSPLPDSDQALANIARVPLQKFLDNSAIVREFFSKDEATGKLLLKRCEVILEDQSKRSKTYAENGRKGGRKSADKKPNENNGKKAIALQNGSTSHHITSQDIDYPPLPPNGKHFNGGGFDILNLISEDGLMDARSAAYGWDVQGYLVPFYNDQVNSGKFERPKYPDKAFPAWCKSFTKGKPP